MPKTIPMTDAVRPTAAETAAKRSTLRASIYFLVASMLICALLILFGLYTPAYVLTVDGVAIGPVAGQEMVEGTVSQVEGQISRILDQDYRMEGELAYRFTIAPKDALVGYAALSEKLYALCPEIKQAYILSVDGVEVGAAKEKSVLDVALADLQAAYRTENTQQVYFANSTRIARRYVPASTDYMGRSKVVEAVSQPVTAPAMQQEGLSTRLLSGDVVGTDSITTQLNTGGEAIASSPLLSVYTMERITETRMVESPIREVADDTIYEGERVLISQGTDGSVEVVADVLYLNGEKKGETILSVQVITPITDTVVSVGTKERPTFMGNGDYQWPCEGTVTSPFGPRNIFGQNSFHGGMDIANSNGTAIYAADSGIVTFSGSQGTYGNYIIVDHGNGQETLYAHCSGLLVQEGEGVLKGQQIATMGATGRATGNHCHFEVRVDGEKMDPMHFLP